MQVTAGQRGPNTITGWPRQSSLSRRRTIDDAMVAPVAKYHTQNRRFINSLIAQISYRVSRSMDFLQIDGMFDGCGHYGPLTPIGH